MQLFRCNDPAVGKSTLTPVLWKAAVDARPGGYKARPLSGVWASAPYLHNGSVPTLAELLKPPAERAAKFDPSSREFDPVAVGLVAGNGGAIFDTALPGNTNTGHAYGMTIADPDKRALVEYLKSL